MNGLILDNPAKHPFLPDRPEKMKKNEYTLVLDLDETLIHWFFVIDLILIIFTN